MRRRTLFLNILVLTLASLAAAEIREVTLLHTNDLHARLLPLENGHGGFAYLASLIHRERARCGECLLLNAGDLVQGSPVSTIFRGLPVYEIGNLLGFDAATIGNHEFDYGWEQVRRFIEIAKYPMVVSNLVDDAGRLFARPYVILKTNGVRVAIIGAVTEDLRSLSKPKDIGPWKTTPLVATIERYAAEARKDADIVIVLAHITEAEETAVLQSAPDISVIISGHAHRGLAAPVVNGDRVLVRLRAYGEELGRLKLKVDTERKSVVSWTWERLPVDGALEPDKEVAGLVKTWEDKVTKVVDQPLVVSQKEFSKPEVKRLIEDAMRDATGADLAFMNPGGVRDTLPKGQLLVRHIWNVMPFDNFIVVGRFKGSQLPKVVTDGHDIDPSREYTLAVSDFTAANQSARGELQTTGLTFSSDGPIMRDAIIAYVRKLGELR